MAHLCDQKCRALDVLLPRPRRVAAVPSFESYRVLPLQSECGKGAVVGGKKEFMSIGL